MVVKELIEHDAAGELALTKQGRAKPILLISIRPNCQISDMHFLPLAKCYLWRPFESEGPLNDHKLKIGQRVNYRPRAISGWGICRIVQLVPPVDDDPQYRIKRETESHLRSAKESELTALDGL
jgi:hypothetical protein